MPLWLKIFISLLVVAVIAFLLANAPGWFYHPLGVCSAGSKAAVEQCKGYNFWSGIISDLGEVSLIGAALTLILGFWHQHNCHVDGCPRLIFHAHPMHGHPVCKVHWQDEGTEHDLVHPHHGLNIFHSQRPS